MAGDRFSGLSLIVDIAAASVPADITALCGPAHWNPALSRKIFHETVHYWQYVSHGFLLALVEEEWCRLGAWEPGGKPPPAGPIKRRFLDRDNRHGISVLDLIEAHARFMDVHAFGPPRLIELELDDPHRVTDPVLTRATYDRLKAEGRIWQSIDEDGNGRGYSELSFSLAMRLAAGGYGRPYLEIEDRTDTVRASILFPLCAHFALHCHDPVAVFYRLLDELEPQVVVAPNGRIEDHWRRFFIPALFAASRIQFEHAGTAIQPGFRSIYGSELMRGDGHAGFGLAATLMDLAAAYLLTHRRGDFLVAPPTWVGRLRADWTLDFLLGICSLTDARAPDLLGYLAPPCVRFGDGEVWVLGEVFDRLDLDTPLTRGPRVPRRQVLPQLFDLAASWENLQLAGIGG